jgi:glycosyltransferase involved in cell wall biosynthesis
MKLSVVVPFYNAEKYIEDCIRALLSQNFPENDYEIIMVDNNSSDNSAEIVARYPLIHLLSEDKQGAYAARNRGISEAKGEIIAFTDPDCLPSADWLQNIDRAMHCPDVGIVLGSRKFSHNFWALPLLAAYEKEKDIYIFSSHNKEMYFGYTNNMAVKRTLFEKLGLFFELLHGADTVFVHHAVDAFGCDIVCYSPEIIVLHMEITGILIFYLKVYAYGKNNKINSDLMTYRPLSNAEKLQIFAKTVAKTKLSIRHSVLLLCLLAVGNTCQILGRTGGILRKWKKREIKVRKALQ